MLENLPLMQEVLGSWRAAAEAAPVTTLHLGSLPSEWHHVCRQAAAAPLQELISLVRFTPMIVA